MMITTTFTVAPLYWEDVWKTEPIVCGGLLCIGEFIAFLALILLQSEYLRNWKLAQQPAMIMTTAIIALIAMSPMAFSHLAAFGGSISIIYADAVGTVLINVANSLLHSSGIELMVLALPHHLFHVALSRGYVAKRFVNSGFGIIFAFLYEISVYLPYQFVFGFFVIYLSSMCIVFHFYELTPSASATPGSP